MPSPHSGREGGAKQLCACVRVRFTAASRSNGRAACVPVPATAPRGVAYVALPRRGGLSEGTISTAPSHLSTAVRHALPARLRDAVALPAAAGACRVRRIRSF